MLFNSDVYIFIFFPIVIAVYFILNKLKFLVGGKIWLIIASLVFYAWFNIKYLYFFVVYLFINYTFYYFIKKFRKEKRTKILLVSAITFNLITLGLFKYLNFFVDTINSIFLTKFPLIEILLPLAISFQTLQQIGFLKDTADNEKINYGFIDYCLFFVFFPQLIVGPIVKHSETIPQFNNLRKKFFNHKNFIFGLAIFLIGFYKKSFIVDTLSAEIFSKIEIINSMSSIEALLFSIMEYFHIYLDVSSYMDMSLGSALMLNINIPINFNSPMFAKDIVDFWQRWHITFSRFMKNYVYNPLKSLNPKEWFINFSIILTCFLGGLWQGASLLAILWGLFHGIGFIINRYWKKLNIKIPNFITISITFLYVSMLGMFLRLPSIQDLKNFYCNLFSLTKLTGISINLQEINLNIGLEQHSWGFKPVLYCLIGIIFIFFRISVEGKDLAKYVKPNFIWALILAIGIIELIYFYSPPTGFLYYNF